jgi:iron(III) transport system substrate-binding protein
LLELTNAAWRGRVALAYPVFGSTAGHFLALRSVWGPERWRAWCLALKANAPIIVDGNSVVVRLVGQGHAHVGLTDSDDVSAGQREGWPVRSLPLGAESLLIPNTVAVVRGAPHRDAALQLLEYLRQPGVVEQLIEAHALEPAPDPAVAAATLHPDWSRVLGDLEAGIEELGRIFAR